MLALKILVASVTPAGNRPVAVIDPAAMKPGAVLATEPTLAASLAACNLLRSWVARE